MHKFILGVLLATQSINLAFADDAFEKSSQILCPSYLNETLCTERLAMFKEVMLSEPSNFEEFSDQFKVSLAKRVNDSEVMNDLLSSPFMRDKLSALPLELEFKMLDRKEGDSVIGLGFNYSRSFSRKNFESEGEYNTSFQFAFDLNGVVTQNADENPTNFIVSKLSAYGSLVPSFNLNKVTVAAVPDICETAEHVDYRDCILYDANQINAFFEPIASAFYLDYGLDIGYETDQSFEASNTTIGGFLNLGYEDFSRDSFMGYYSIRPSIRLAVEQIAPSDETPRALLGEDDSYQRLYGEASIVLPLQNFINIPYYFNFSYRAYEEMSASNIVKDANLDAFQLRTYSLVTPFGVALSYTSGRLPFGVENEKTVELGYKIYF